MDFNKFLRSKRFAITIYVLVAWLVFGILGIIYGANMSEFAAYFAALSPFIIGYIYGETKRSSNSKNNV